jgi:ketosteroid isomerase-like protein
VDTRDANIKSIQDGLAQWQKDFAAKDVDKLVSHCSDDWLFVNPGSPVVKGREATNPATKQPFEDKGTYLAVYKKQADGAWKAVVDMGTSEIFPAVPAPPPLKK